MPSSHLSLTPVMRPGTPGALGWRPYLGSYKLPGDFELMQYLLLQLSARFCGA